MPKDQPYDAAEHARREREGQARVDEENHRRERSGERERHERDNDRCRPHPQR